MPSDSSYARQIVFWLNVIDTSWDLWALQKLLIEAENTQEGLNNLYNTKK